MLTPQQWNNIYTKGRDYRLMNKFLLPKLILTKPGKALDIGCGNGQLALLLDTEGFEVQGIDLSEVAISNAQKKVPTATFSVQNVEEDFPEGKFQLITCKLVFAFLHHKKQFFENAFRHLADDGELIIITPIAVKGEEYSDHYMAISVSEDELQDDMFEEVHREQEYDYENEIMAYICYKKKQL